MTTMRLVTAHRLDPKRAFRCPDCDPPSKKTRVIRRYLFVMEGPGGQRGDYCLPCAAKYTGRSQYEIRKETDAAAGINA